MVAKIAQSYYNMDYNEHVEKFVSGNSFINQDVAHRVTRPGLGGIWLVDSSVEALNKNGIGMI